MSEVSVWLATGSIWEVVHGVRGLGCFRSRESAIEWAEANGYTVINK